MGQLQSPNFGNYGKQNVAMTHGIVYISITTMQYLTVSGGTIGNCLEKKSSTTIVDIMSIEYEEIH